MQQEYTSTLNRTPSCRLVNREQDSSSAYPRSLTVTATEGLSPKIKLSRSTTALDLLAAFSPTKRIGTAPSPLVPGAMDPGDGSRGLRQKERISYNIPDDSDSVESPSAVSSAFPTPQKASRQQVVDLDGDTSEEIELRKTPPPRISSAGHKLRAHNELHLSLKAQENGDKSVTKKRKLTLTSRANHKKQKLILTSDAKPGVASTATLPAATNRTARNEIRDAIATETAGKRSTFFIAKKDYFLPLLPESNYISRLAEKSDCIESNGSGSTVQYESIDVQPKGWVMTSSGSLLRS